MTTKEAYTTAAALAAELHCKVGQVMVNGTRKELREAQDERRSAELKRDELYQKMMTEEVSK